MHGRTYHPGRVGGAWRGAVDSNSPGLDSAFFSSTIRAMPTATGSAYFAYGQTTPTNLLRALNASSDLISDILDPIDAYLSTQYLSRLEISHREGFRLSQNDAPGPHLGILF